MNTAIKDFWHARDSILLRMERLQQYVKTFDTSNQDVSELKARHKTVDLMAHQFEKIQLKIEYQQLTEADSEELLKESHIVRMKFEEQFYKLKSSMLFAIKVSTETIKPKFKQESQPTELFRLPKIDLEIFTGKPDNWLSFYDVFTTIIHENNTLTTIQKFKYLRSSLKDEAARVILNLEISNQNYEIAWSRLRNRYDNKKLKQFDELIDRQVVLKDEAALASGISKKIPTNSPQGNTNQHICNCSSFIQLNIPDRRQLVQQLDMHFNCLNDTHQHNSRTSTSKYKICHKDHTSYPNFKKKKGSMVEWSNSTDKNTPKFLYHMDAPKTSSGRHKSNKFNTFASNSRLKTEISKLIGATATYKSHDIPALKLQPALANVDCCKKTNYQPEIIGNNQAREFLHYNWCLNHNWNIWYHEYSQLQFSNSLHQSHHNYWESSNHRLKVTQQCITKIMDINYKQPTTQDRCSSLPIVD